MRSKRVFLSALFVSSIFSFLYLSSLRNSDKAVDTDIRSGLVERKKSPPLRSISNSYAPSQNLEERASFESLPDDMSASELAVHIESVLAKDADAPSLLPPQAEIQQNLAQADAVAAQLLEQFGVPVAEEGHPSGTSNYLQSRIDAIRASLPQGEK